jgi:hypothetical protein
MRRLMLRDWEFTRQAVKMLPAAGGATLLLIGGSSPFSGMSALHFAPHAWGFLFMVLAGVIPLGGQRKTVWLFQLLPDRVFNPFVRGMFLSIWIPFVVLPHLIAVIFHSVTWGPTEALVFSAYSLAITTLYLSLDFKKIGGLPFTKPRKPEKGFPMEGFAILILRGGIAAAAVALQYFVIFRWTGIAVLASLLLFAVSYVAWNFSVNQLQSAIKRQLENIATGQTLFQLDD